MNGHIELLHRCIEPYTVVDPVRFAHIYRLLQETRELPGDIGEVGVYRGGVSAGMALGSPEKRLHLFDTFCGLRQPATPGERHGAGDFADTSLPQVLALFPDGHPLVVHQGWFPETVTEELRATRFSFLHIDGAYYETIRDAISFFYPRLTPGGVMIFDDWEWEACPGVKRGLMEGQEQFGYEIRPLAPWQAFIQKANA